MEGRRSRNYLIFSEKTDVLDELLPTRASKVKYDTDRYIVSFKNPKSPHAVKLCSGCQNVKPVFRRLPKLDIEDDKSKKLLQRMLLAKQNYEEKIARGKLMAEILQVYNIPEDSLDGSDKNAYLLFKKTKKIKSRVNRRKKTEKCRDVFPLNRQPHSLLKKTKEIIPRVNRQKVPDLFNENN